MTTPLMPDFSTMLPDEVLVWVHVPEADTLPWADAVRLAKERNQQAAGDLEADASTLRIEEAARAAQFEFLADQATRVNADLVQIGQRLDSNGDLRMIQTEAELKILRERGY